MYVWLWDVACQRLEKAKMQDNILFRQQDFINNTNPILYTSLNNKLHSCFATNNYSKAPHVILITTSTIITVIKHMFACSPSLTVYEC